MSAQSSPATRDGGGPNAGTTPERSLADLLRELNHASRELIRQEFRLARAELRENADKVRNAAMLAGAGVSLGIIALVCLALAATHGLGLLIGDWAAALCVAGGTGVVAVVLLRAGLGKLEGVDMSETVDSLTDGRELAERQIETLQEQVMS